MKALQPPDILRLQAAQGLCELHAFAEVDAELEQMTLHGVRTGMPSRDSWPAHPPALVYQNNVLASSLPSAVLVMQGTNEISKRPS